MFLGTGTVFSQNISNAVKTSLTSPFLRTYLIAYERVINQDMGAQLGFYYTGFKLGDAKFSGYAITPEFRYYLSETKGAPSGGFVAPFFRYQNFTLENKNDPAAGKGTFTRIGGGLIVGTQRVFKDKITLSAFIGPYYGKSDLAWDDPNDQLDFGLNTEGRWWARSGINIGLAF